METFPSGTTSCPETSQRAADCPCSLPSKSLLACRCCSSVLEGSGRKERGMDGTSTTESCGTMSYRYQAGSQYQTHLQGCFRSCQLKPSAPFHARQGDSEQMLCIPWNRPSVLLRAAPRPHLSWNRTLGWQQGDVELLALSSYQHHTLEAVGKPGAASFHLSIISLPSFMPDSENPSIRFARAGSCLLFQSFWAPDCGFTSSLERFTP